MPKMSDEAPAAQDVHDDRTLPVRVYESDGRVMVAAPMPGLEPRDISVSVSGDHVTIHGALRGPHQDERELSVAEWAIGPYHRDLTLRQTVDGARANATYGNGVLVLALPKSERGARGRAARFTLDVLTSTHGARVGHTGKDLRRTTTAAQLNKQRDVAEQASKSRPAATAKPATRPDRGAASGRTRRSSTAGPVNV
jgi:HSP20 family protein